MFYPVDLTRPSYDALRREVPVTLLARSFLITFCLLLAYSSVAAQQRQVLEPNAPLAKTLEWLKANIPFAYTQPRNRERKELTREAITHVRFKGCTMSYDVTSEPFQAAATGDQVNHDVERNEWRIELGGLNSRHIKFEAATDPDLPARIAFSSFDPGNPEVASKLKQTGPTVFVNYTNKAIWHSHRMGVFPVRAEFVSWATVPVKNETVGTEIVKALSHAVDLCHQLKPAKTGP